MPKFFGTDGIRTKAGEFPLTETALFTIGQALGELLENRLNHKARAIIGRDTRASGSWIESSLGNGLMSVGAEVVSAGIITTPGVAYLTKNFGYDVGIVISASHNPYEDNGIKIFSPSGRKFDEHDEEFIESKLLASQLGLDDNSQNPIKFLSELPTHYLNFLKKEIAQNLKLSGLKIALDCANGAAINFATKLFQDLDAELVLIGCQADGQNINENCGSLHLDNLKALVKKENCSLGIAFDGDADRTLFVDETGEIVDGDRILYILARHFLSHQKLNPKLIVATVMSNLGLEVALKNLGIDLKRTPVGDKYVLEELLATDSIVGGEQSGHIIFPHISLAGDGIVTALQVLHVLANNQEKHLSELSKDFITFPQILINVKVKSKPAFSSIPAIADAAKKVESELAGQGRLLLRYSGTENLARVMIEGKNLSEITAQAEYLAKIIQETI
jgi:phosphoglucosamine mutase